MSFIFGDYAETGPDLESGMYEATIASMAITMENGKPKKNANDKVTCDVHFEIDDDTTVKRRYPIGFGQNKANNEWSAWSKFLEAATGVRCGDEQQKRMSDAQVVGRRVRIVCERTAAGYTNVTSVLPVPKGSATQAKPKPAPLPVDSGFADPNDAPDNDEIPW